MNKLVKGCVAALGAAALAVPALAQQQGGQRPPQGQGQGQGQAPQQGGQGGPGGGGGRPPGPPPNTGVPLSAKLVGARGTGYAGVVIDPPAGQVCYLLNATLAEAPTAAHIHSGEIGGNGPPVVPMATPADGASGGCQPIAANLAQQILANPGGYYVNVHTASQPQGAIAGKLAR